MIAVVTVLSRVLGFGRWLAQAHAVGAGAIGDATTPPTRCRTCCSRSPPAGRSPARWCPCWPLPVARGARKDIDGTVSGTAGLDAAGPRAARGAARRAEQADRPLLTSRHPDQTAMVEYFLRVFAVQVPMYGVAVLLYAVLQAHKRFFWPAFAPILSSLVVIATYLVYAAWRTAELATPRARPAGARVARRGGPRSVSPRCASRCSCRCTASACGSDRPCTSPRGRAARRGRSLSPGSAPSSRSSSRWSWSSSVVDALGRARARSRHSSGPSRSICCRTPCSSCRWPPRRSPGSPRAPSSGDRGGFARMASGTIRAVLAAGALGAAAVIAAAPRGRGHLRGDRRRRRRRSCRR